MIRFPPAVIRIRFFSFIFGPDGTYDSCVHYGAAFGYLVFLDEVDCMVPLIRFPTPCASRPNLFALERVHSSGRGIPLAFLSCDG